MREADGEVMVTAEVPGLERDDLDLSISPGGLTIRGQKKMERTSPQASTHGRVAWIRRTAWGR
jgi:HSP20 family protein